MSRREMQIAGLAIASALGWLVTLYMNAHTALLAYLSAFLPFAETALGCLFILMLGFLVPGRWFESLRLPLNATALTMPVIGLLFLPILVGLPLLYDWAKAPAILHGFKSVYLSTPVFAARMIFYFLLWSAIAFQCLRVHGNEVAEQRLASWGLVAYALTASLAGVDWIESLTPDFHSSVYGLLFLSSQVLVGMAFIIVAIPALYKSERPLTIHGQLLFSAVLAWGYLHAMQYIIIWAANRPDEVKWYVDRSIGGWAATTWFVYLSQFALPFLAFLLARVRENVDAIIAMGISFLIVRIIESFWLILPGQEFDSYLLPISALFALIVCGAVFSLTLLAILHAIQHRRKWLMPFLPAVQGSKRG